MKKLKIGIVGLGRVASKTHIPVLKSLGNVEVVAGVEKNPERAERVKRLFGLARVYDRYEDMFDSEKLDGVYVCLPNFLHKDACIKALERGLHVLCEKPMGMSVKEAEEMTALAEAKGLVLMPGYKKRYARNFKRAKELIEDGLLGKIIQVQGIFVTPGPYISWDPKSDWYLDEKWHGVIYDTACHLVDLLLYLVPYEILDLKVVSQHGFDGYNTPTNVGCTFEMEGGIVGDLTVGWRASTDILSLSIHGTAGSINVSQDYFVYVNSGTDPVDKIKMALGNAYSACSSLLRKVKDKVRGNNFYTEDLLQSKAFVKAISKIQRAPINGGDAIKVHKFLEQMIAFA
jgi:UDP-N-acetylglucosamine 3-dehydrogenase